MWVPILFAASVITTSAQPHGLDLTLNREIFSDGAGHLCGHMTCRAEGNNVTIVNVVFTADKSSGASKTLLTVNLTNPERQVTMDDVKGNGVLKYNRASLKLDLLQGPSCESDSFTCHVTFINRAGEQETEIATAGPEQSPDVQLEETTPHKPETCDPGMGDGATETRTKYLILNNTDIDRQILCDTQTDGGGWIVFQRRVDGEVDFYRNWTEYREGFGNLTGDFWLGLEELYILTNTHTYQLRIDVQVDGENLFADYSTFRVENERQKYRLRVGSYSGTIGEFSSYAGMAYHNNTAFSTFDADNDGVRGENCAVQWHGAWWYRDCHSVNLNGVWGIKSGQGVRWFTERDILYPSFTEMKIRRL